MHRLILRLVPAAALLLAVSGCTSNNTTDTLTAPAPTLVDTFTGTLAPNGGTSYSFTVTGVGSVAASLTTLTTPDSTIPIVPIGLSLGTWNGSICQVVLANDASIQGSLVVGQASTTGTFCVRVYDAGGKVVQPESYVVDVSHP